MKHFIPYFLFYLFFPIVTFWIEWATCQNDFFFQPFWRDFSKFNQMKNFHHIFNKIHFCELWNSESNGLGVKMTFFRPSSMKISPNRSKLTKFGSIFNMVHFFELWHSESNGLGVKMTFFRAFPTKNSQNGTKFGHFWTWSIFPNQEILNRIS